MIRAPGISTNAWKWRVGAELDFCCFVQFWSGVGGYPGSAAWTAHLDYDPTGTWCWSGTTQLPKIETGEIWRPHWDLEGQWPRVAGGILLEEAQGTSGLSTTRAKCADMNTCLVGVYFKIDFGWLYIPFYIFFPWPSVEVIMQNRNWNQGLSKYVSLLDNLITPTGLTVPDALPLMIFPSLPVVPLREICLTLFELNKDHPKSRLFLRN